MSEWDDDDGYNEGTSELSGELDWDSTEGMSTFSGDDDFGDDLDGNDAAAQFLVAADSSAPTGTDVYGNSDPVKVSRHRPQSTEPRILHNTGAMPTLEDRMHGRSRKFHNDTDPDSVEQLDEAYGGATPFDLQLTTVQGMEPRIQAGLREVLTGGSLKGVSAIESLAARQEFEKVIGASGADFAARLKIDGSVSAPLHPADIKKVLSITGSAEVSMDRGPGFPLPGNFIDSGSDTTNKSESKRQLAYDKSFEKAQKFLKEITMSYIPQETIGSPIEGARVQAVSDKLTKRLLEGTFYKGSTSLLPVPREVGVRGLVRTQGIYASAQGTKHTRLTASEYDWAYEKTPSGGFARDSNGYKIMLGSVSEEEKVRILRGTPSLANSLFPIEQVPKGQTRSEEETAFLRRQQRDKMADFQWKGEYIRNAYRKRFPTLRDESAGQMNMAGWDRPYDEQAEMSELRDEASLMGNSWDDLYAGSQGIGEGIGPQQEYIQQRLEAGTSLNEEIALEEAAALGDGLMGPPVMTDRDKYLAMSAGSPAQRTPAWYALRKDLVTASTAKKLTSRKSLDRMTADLAEQRLVPTRVQFEGNSDTQEGQEFEGAALKSFMAKFGKELDYEEAFFEKNKDLPGIGASPDGRLFNKDGTSAGLLELKVLTGGSLKTSLKDYMNQMQMQMMVAKENKTHFYGLNKHTGQYAHEVVYADKGLQEELYAKAFDVHSKASKLTAGEVVEMREQIEMDRPSKGDPINTQAFGQQSSYVPKRDVAEDIITPYRPGAAPPLPSNESVMARATNRLSARGRTEAPGDVMSEMFKIKKEDLYANGLGSSDVTDQHQEALSENIRLNKEAAAAQSKLAKSASNAAERINSFTSKAGKAAGVLGELGGLLLQGGESGRATINFADIAGYEKAGDVRGIENLLRTQGNLDEGQAIKIMAGAADTVATFRSPTKLEGAATRMHEGWSALGGRAGPAPTIPQMQAGPKELIALALEKSEGLDAMDKRLVYDAIDPRIGALAATGGDIAPEDLLQAFPEMSRDELKEFYRGTQEKQILERKAKEDAAAESGFVGGFGAEVAQSLDGIINSKTVGAIAGGGALYAGRNKIKSALARKTAQQTARTAALRFASTAVRAGPAGLAIGTGALVGAGVGNTIYEGIDDLPIGRGLGALLVGGMAKLGNDEAQAAVDRMENYERIKEASEVGAPEKTRSRGRGRNRRGISISKQGLAPEVQAVLPTSDEIRPIDIIPELAIEQALLTETFDDSETAMVNNIELNVSVDPYMVSSDININGEDYSDEELGYV